MDLKWWPILVGGVVCLAVGVIAVWQLPVQRVQRRLRPLAHVDRLTRLPEFARVQRVYRVSMAISAAMLGIAFLSAIMAAARPVQAASDAAGYDAAHPRDVMLCVGQPVTDPTTADLLRFYADRANPGPFDALGITSANLRVMPMTRERGFARGRLEYFADMAQIQQDLDTRQDVPVEKRIELAGGIDAFARAVTYVDYAPSVEDALALCMTGFPGFENPSEHRRQLVFLGYSRWRDADERRPPLYDSGQIQAMAQRGGVQINVISRADVADSSPEANDMMRGLTTATGGSFSLYNPAGTAGSSGGSVLADKIAEINDHPPLPSRSGANGSLQREVDTPRLALAAAAIAAVLLAMSLAVLRR